MESYNKGFVRLGSFTDKGMSISYLSSGMQKKIEDGSIPVVGHNKDGSIIFDVESYQPEFIPGTQWRIKTHDATEHGTKLLQDFIGNRFSYPKSLYSTHDAIMFYVSNKPNALIVDFFAGSGTTLHAVNLLNAEDGGRRRCIIVTNNEVSAEERKEFEDRGINHGDEEWLNRGIARYKVIVSPAQVRQSGLLKDRIVITYPEDPAKHSDMAVLQAATDEWQDKCKHWYQYTYEQHYTNVNPVFVIQVCAGSGKKISDTDLDDVIAKIEERIGETFKEHEVVHTFGSTGTLSIHGLNVHHIEPSEIAEDRRVRVVLFKENLSTGWDCPRAETMMSFRRAEDATYIAQLLGRMVRTPLQCHVLVDDSLNEVRLYLPYFNRENVKKVIDELQASEGGEIPTVVEGESLDHQVFDTWTVHTTKKKPQKQVEGQTTLEDFMNSFGNEPASDPALVEICSSKTKPNFFCLASLFTSF